MFSITDYALYLLRGSSIRYFYPFLVQDASEKLHVEVLCILVPLADRC